MNVVRHDWAKILPGGLGSVTCYQEQTKLRALLAVSE